MKFRLLSDLHLEFHQDYREFVVPVLPNEKQIVLLLAGDIEVGLHARSFIEDMCERHHTVIYILGNHEFYNNKIQQVRRDWAALADGIMPSNFVFLDDGQHIIEDCRILGGTLWTSFNNGEYWAKLHAKNGMNDFDVIQFIEGDRLRKFLPEDAHKLHRYTIDFLRHQLSHKWDGKNIVMTHHLPHPLCVSSSFRGHALNDAYMSNLDDFIYDHDIALWVHGHTHDNVDFNIHGTHILCNPRGYHGSRINPGFNPNLVVTV